MPSLTSTFKFGESVALYFSFVSAYGKFLLFPSAAGMGFYFFGTPYSAVYSSLLCLWSITFVEWWRIRERILSVRWSTRGSFRVERRRAQYLEGTSSLTRELRTAVSVPVILLCAGILGALLTGLFVFEAFITTLYTGPGHQHIVSVASRLFCFFRLTFCARRAWCRRSSSWQSSRASSRSTRRPRSG